MRFSDLKPSVRQHEFLPSLCILKREHQLFVLCTTGPNERLEHLWGKFERRCQSFKRFLVQVIFY